MPFPLGPFQHVSDPYQDHRPDKCNDDGTYHSTTTRKTQQAEDPATNDAASAFPDLKRNHHEVLVLDKQAKPSALDSKYTLVKTVWNMSFRTNEGDEITLKTRATYLLSAAGDSFEIVFQLDHQDLMKMVQDLRAQAPSNP